MTSSLPDLRVCGLTIRYGGATALREVDLQVPGGSVTALVGPNGAGKSSLMLGVYGSVVSSGSVLVDGEEFSGLRPTARARRGVAIVPQGRQLFPRLNVQDNFKVMATNLRLPPSAVDEAMDRFPVLRSRARILAGVLSGGEQQMLVVARALMSSPRVLLLDEMTTGLAPRIVQELVATVRQLSENGVAVLIAEPAIGALRPLIDRGYVLIRGQIAGVTEDGGEALDRIYQATLGVQNEQSADVVADSAVVEETAGLGPGTAGRPPGAPSNATKSTSTGAMEVIDG